MGFADHRSSLQAQRLDLAKRSSLVDVVCEGAVEEAQRQGKLNVLKRVRSCLFFTLTCLALLPALTGLEMPCANDLINTQPRLLGEREVSGC